MTNSIIEDTEIESIISRKLHDLSAEEIKGLNIDDFKRLIRLAYLERFVKPQPTYCPECGSQLTTTEDDDEVICTGCGLITSMSVDYVAGFRITLPYGRH